MDATYNNGASTIVYDNLYNTCFILHTLHWNTIRNSTIQDDIVQYDTFLRNSYFEKQHKKQKTAARF